MDTPKRIQFSFKMNFESTKSKLVKLIIMLKFTSLVCYINCAIPQLHAYQTRPSDFFIAFACFISPVIMAPSLRSLSFIFAILLLMQAQAGASTCSDCFVQSRASYYPNSDEQGTDQGRCGYGSFGATINDGDVSAVSDLYRDGVGCGACYQVRCTNSAYCSDKGVTVVITDQGSGHNTDFIMSRRAFGRMAQTTDTAASLFSLGVVEIEYRRVSCRYPSKNITIKIDENSNSPHYWAFVIWYQQGKRDITAVQLCETQNFVCKLLDRSYGAVWTTSSPPSGPLQVRMLFSDEDNGDESWVVPVNNIPQDWKPGQTYDTGVQVDF